jgi:hypothetical protein
MIERFKISQIYGGKYWAKADLSISKLRSVAGDTFYIHPHFHYWNNSDDVPAKHIVHEGSNAGHSTEYYPCGKFI